MSVASKKAFPGPDLDYKVAPNLYIGYYSQHQAIVTTVRACPADVFARLVRIAARRARNPDACLKELAASGLNFEDPESKWYAMLILLRHHARPFWASSYIDSRLPARGKQAVS